MTDSQFVGTIHSLKVNNLQSYLTLGFIQFQIILQGLRAYDWLLLPKFRGSSTPYSQNLGIEVIEVFFENFSRICKERKTSPTVVVSKLGMSKNTASYWKKNGNLPNDEQLQELAKILDCHVSDFFTDPSGFHATVTNVHNHVGNGTIGNVVTSVGDVRSDDYMGALTDDERELVSMYRRLSVIDRARLMVTVDNMMNSSDTGDQ